MKKVREQPAVYTVNSKPAIPLPEIVLEDLREIVKFEGVTAEEAVSKAITHYYYEIARRKINAEAEIYKRKHPRLRVKYHGLYIAMHNGRVVDHALDMSALYKRVRARFGRTPILMRQVTDEPEPVIVVRSPRIMATKP